MRRFERLLGWSRSAFGTVSVAPVAPPLEGDILGEERRSRLRFLAPGYWLVGRVGVFVLVAFLVVAFAWFGFLRSDRDVHFVRADAVDAPVVEDVGRALFAGEYSIGEAYGEPIGLGEHGRPVVRHYVTGQERELTPVEMEYDKYDQFVSAGFGDVVFNPGPRGWGMWWRDDSDRIAELNRLYFVRQDWRDRQEEELEQVVSDAMEGVLFAFSFDLERWERGNGVRLGRRVDEVVARYDYRVGLGGWEMVPGQWVCDPVLESELHSGVTPGCPTGEFNGLLVACWIRVGVVLDRLELVSRVATGVDGLDLREFDSAQAVLRVGYPLLQLEQDLGRLEDALAALERRSLMEDLPIGVTVYAK